VYGGVWCGLSSGLWDGLCGGVCRVVSDGLWGSVWYGLSSGVCWVVCCAVCRGVAGGVPGDWVLRDLQTHVQRNGLPKQIHGKDKYQERFRLPISDCRLQNGRGQEASPKAEGQRTKQVRGRRKSQAPGTSREVRLQMFNSRLRNGRGQEASPKAKGQRTKQGGKGER